MEHLVRFTTAEGREGHHYADTIEAALAFVERVRNSEEASAVRVFRLREVPIEFKAYYKVGIREAEEAPIPAPVVVEDHPEPAPRPLVATAAALEGDHGDNGSGRRLFHRG